MAGVLSLTLLLCACNIYLFQYAAAADTSTAASTISLQAPNPLPPSKISNPYYNNQYYNQNRGGPVVPILSYSSEHVGDGTYAFRMAGVLSSTLLLCVFICNIYLFIFATAADTSTVVPTIPPPNPLPPSKISNPYYNNQYYNQNRVGPVVPILSYSSEHVGDGTYAFSFATGDGKQAQESGFLKDAYIDNNGNPQGTQVVQGSFAYVSPEGTPIQVSYVADENGFRPSGVHIPADGKTILPLPIVDGKDRPFDPLYNRYNPYDYRNPYDQYNRPYDPRHPYNPMKYNPYYNRYNPYVVASQNKEAKNKTV